VPGVLGVSAAKEGSGEASSEASRLAMANGRAAFRKAAGTAQPEAKAGRVWDKVMGVRRKGNRMAFVRSRSWLRFR
jgi:hypothetical protein